jgi:uncharacterized membrane protein YcfT
MALLQLAKGTSCVPNWDARAMAATSAPLNKPRVEWVDYAKGICIILVVMMHSTLGVEKALGTTGHLSAFIEWARPFRMPDFFLISGLFLSRRIDGDWRDYLDKKVIHFGYFYVLWYSIQFALKGHGFYQDLGLAGLIQHYALGFIEPFGTLWFIYMLAIFFCVVKLTRNLPPLLVFAVGAGLEMAHIHTGWSIIDEFAARFVYFFAGYWLSTLVFNATNILWQRSLVALMAMLYLWGAGHSLAMVNGVSKLPVVSLVLGFAGASAVITTSIVLARSGGLRWLRYFGENSIVIYLAFVLFMGPVRAISIKLVPAINPDVLSLLTTTVSIMGALSLFWLVRNSKLAFLFKRPHWAKLKPRANPVETKQHSTYSAGHDLKPLAKFSTDVT